ncbi:MAG: hypothetical protein IJF49_00850 [Clostridia bacterium]|nr:hypothetical protein [Clostridia bacterium]
MKNGLWKITTAALLVSCLLVSCQGEHIVDKSNPNQTNAGETEITGIPSQTTGSPTQTTVPVETTTAPVETTTVPAETTTITEAEVRNTYADKPYARLDQVSGMSHFSMDTETFLKEYDWETIYAQIPDTYYESYPKSHNVPDSATLYQNGEVTEIALDDPRLIKLLNFYYNSVYYMQHAYVQGAFRPDDYSACIDTPFRIELTYTPKRTGEEDYWEKMFICYNEKLAGVDFVVYSDKPYAGGLYPFYASGRYPLSAQCVNWLDLFGF